MRRAAVPIAIAIAIAALAGCGGDDSSSNEIAEWARNAQADCKALASELSGTSQPLEILELLDAGPAVASTVASTARKIERRPVPEGAGATRTFAGVVSVLRKRAMALGEATGLGDTEAVVKAVRELHEVVPRVSTAARAAGAPACGDSDAIEAVLDGARAPIFIDHAGKVIDDMRERTRPVLAGGRASEEELLEAATELDDAHSRLGTLDPPTWAQAAFVAHHDALAELARAVGERRGIPAAARRERQAAGDLRELVRARFEAAGLDPEDSPI